MLNLPNPEMNFIEGTVKKNIHILNFMYDDTNDIENKVPFSYYKYQGSRT